MMLKKARDLVVGIAAVVLLVAAFWNGSEWWDWFIISLAVVVAIWELLLRLFTGKTLSQHFWAYNEQHPKGKWVRIGILAVAWAGLLVHLAWH